MTDDKNLVVGETYPYYSYHLREVGGTPVNLGGHVIKPLSLCGRPLAWDTEIPVAAFDACARCVAALGSRGGRASSGPAPEVPTRRRRGDA